MLELRVVIHRSVRLARLMILVSPFSVTDYSPLIQVGYVFQQTLVPQGIDGSIRMKEHTIRCLLFE